MKIICVGRNYSLHAQELQNDIPTEPLLFMKPPSALLINNKPFYYPEFTRDLHYEVEIVLKIAKNGRHVLPDFAASYYSAYCVGIDFTARDVQDRLKANGHPWEIAKGFDHSAPISALINFEDKTKPIHFGLKKNGEWVQRGNTADLLFSFDYLICYISRYFKLQVGDFIFTGTPAGVGSVQIDDYLEAYIGDSKMLTCAIK